VAGVSGAVGASTVARAAANAAHRQAEHDHALRMRQAAIEKVQTTCDAYQVKGQVVLHAVFDFQAAVFEGRDAASEETLFRDCLNILGKAAFDVRECNFELEDPAIDWYAGAVTRNCRAPWITTYSTMTGSPWTTMGQLRTVRNPRPLRVSGGVVRLLR